MSSHRSRYLEVVVRLQKGLAETAALLLHLLHLE